MPNTRETVEALVSAFNVNNYDFNAVKTNFKLQSRGKKDYIVVSFDKSMDRYQCSRYLDSIKRKIVGEFYDAKEGRYEVVLNTGKSIFDVKSFPFSDYKGCWSMGKQGGIEFVALIDDGVIFNLKSHLAASLAKDVLVDMPTCNFSIEAPDKKGCLWLGNFPDKKSCKQFEREFLSRIRERYVNVPKNPLEVEDNSVYIKDVFNDARFIDSVTRRAAWRTGIDLGTGNDVDHSVMLLKDSIINSVYQSTKIIVVGFICASPLNREEASILIPLVLDGGGKRILTSGEALKLNQAFDDVVFRNVNGRIQGMILVNGSSEVYGVDFSNQYISHCVITKIIESSVINKDHELSIDPELPRTLLTESSLTRGLPTRSQGDKLKPRQGSKTEKGGMLYDQLGLAGTSGRPSTWMSCPAVKRVSKPEKCVGAAAVDACTQPITNRWPSQGTSGNKWPQSGSFVNETSSWEDADPVGAQPMGAWSSQSTSGNKRTQSSSFVNGPSSLKGAQADANISKKEEKLIEALLDMFNFNNYIGEIPTNFTLEDGKIVSLLYVDKREYLQKLRNYIIEKHCGIEEEARKVYDFGHFLFVFPPDSNYVEDEGVKDIAYNVSGTVFNLKIHLIQEFKRNVEYKVIKKLKEEMRMTEEKASECIRRYVHLEKVNNPTSYLCDISFSNEYFQNQPKLSNELEIDVEKLFKEFKNIYVEEFKSRLKECGLGDSLVSHEGNMLHIKNAIDIDVVKKVKKYEHEEVPVQQFPHKGVMIEVPIVLQDGSYILDTSGIPSETRPPLRQRARPIEGTSKAGKMKPKAEEKDSGKGTSESELEFMDYGESPCSGDEGSSSESSRSGSSNSSSESDGENTGKGSPKRPLESGMGELAISTNLNATEVESPSKKIKQMF